MNFEHVTYTKINTLYKRDSNNKNKIIIGDFSRPEFGYLYHNAWAAFEKIDGTNMSVYFDGNEMRIDGKSENAQIQANIKTKMEEMFPIEKLKQVFVPKPDENGNPTEMKVIIYGEGYGSKIQKGGGRYISNGVDFRIFDININGMFLELDKVKEYADALGVEMPVRYPDMTLEDAEDMVKNGFISPIAEDQTYIAEGLVLRPLLTMFNRRGERIIVKVKYKDYQDLKK